MKKIVLYILLVTAAFLMIGCKKSTSKDSNHDTDDENFYSITALPTAAPTDSISDSMSEDASSHEGKMRSYLTGEWVSEEIGTKRPWAIQFNNFKLVSNQWGIGQADIVYECIVEGGITRLLGIGENYTGNRIGSVRSSRHYFVSIADEYDAIYIHYGETKYATSKLAELGIDHIEGMAGIGTTVFYRDTSMKAPNNAFASRKGILAGIEKKGFRTQYEEGYEAHYTFFEEDKDLIDGINASKVTLDFSSYTAPYLKYNSEDKLYYRFQFGAAHKDSVTGEQLAFKNIIIQFVKEWDIDKNDYQTMDIEDASGSGYYITNGKVTHITWKKKEADRFMRYYNEAGGELTINPGKTYISLFPKDRKEDVMIEE